MEAFGTPINLQIHTEILINVYSLNLLKKEKKTKTKTKTFIP